MKTQEQILKRISELEANNDMFGFQRSDLIGFLTFENAKKFLKDEVTADKWVTKTDPKKEISDYLPFAWGKANNRRGISAGRSVEHMKAWLWLMEHPLAETLDDDYEFYGKNCLVTVSRIVGFDYSQHDDGSWANDEGSDGLSETERKEKVRSALARAA